MNKELRIKVIVLFIILNSCFLILAPVAQAQTVSLGINPPILQIQAAPPANIPNPITIDNLSDDTVYLDISAKPFTTSPLLNGQIQFIDSMASQGNDPHILDKVSMLDGDTSIDSLTLAPHQSKTLSLVIDIPQDEPPGDYYFTILFGSKAIGSDTSNLSTLTGAVGTNVLLSIGPTDATTGVLEKFEAPFFLEHGPVPFSVLVNNTSKHFTTPQGTIVIKNMFGQAIGKVNLLPVNVLAQSSRYIPSEQPTRYNQPIRQAQDLQQYTNALWPETFLLGLYQANLSLKLSDQGPLFTRSIYFFALPWQGMILLAFLILVIITIVLRVKKKLQ